MLPCLTNKIKKTSPTNSAASVALTIIHTTSTFQISTTTRFQFSLEFITLILLHLKQQLDNIKRSMCIFYSSCVENGDLTTDRLGSSVFRAYSSHINDINEDVDPFNYTERWYNMELLCKPKACLPTICCCSSIEAEENPPSQRS